MLSASVPAYEAGFGTVGASTSGVADAHRAAHGLNRHSLVDCHRLTRDWIARVTFNHNRARVSRMGEPLSERVEGAAHAF